MGIGNRAVDNTAMFLGIRLHIIEEGLCFPWMLCLHLSRTQDNIHRGTQLFLFFFFVCVYSFLSFLLYFPIRFIMIECTFHLNLEKTLKDQNQVPT